MNRSTSLSPLTFPSSLRGRLLAFSLALGFCSAVAAHGDMVPQAVDTTSLPQLGAKWLEANPYDKASPARGEALRIGSSAYNQNCARCHGLEALSGGIAPDLRYLDVGEAGDEWFINRYQHGSARDGKVYMPPLGDVLGQKAGWAIRSWLDSKHEE